MMERKNKAIVFILLGQSNAVGHGVPMEETDKIQNPLKNVFGLSRELNQSYDNIQLAWSGYKSAGMNLAEEQDDTYSVANCLAQLWQKEIDLGNRYNLPDLYIIHIAIGAQGITDKFMWFPERQRKLIPGSLDTVDISLFPFTVHILSLVKESFKALGKKPEFLLHWRGGEEDTSIPVEELKDMLKDIYDRMFNGFCEALGQRIPIVIHRFSYREHFLEVDPSGEYLKSMDYINEVFEKLADENGNISLFDIQKAPHYVSDTRTHGLFIEDAAHCTPETNRWVASQILENFKKGLGSRGMIQTQSID